MNIDYFTNMNPSEILELFDNNYSSIPEHICVGLIGINTENPKLFYDNKNKENSKEEYKWVNNKWELDYE